MGEESSPGLKAGGGFLTRLLFQQISEKSNPIRFVFDPPSGGSMRDQVGSHLIKRPRSIPCGDQILADEFSIRDLFGP